jgi:glycosyltransferase involved in cell wall biosynthesis
MKGIQYFLDAAVILAERFPEARFLVVGDGESRRELEGHAGRLGLGRRVVFTGFRCDVPELLSEAEVCVLPSLSEGLSNALLESMAAGVPVVATRVGGNSEVVEDGLTGLLVPARNPAELAWATGRLLENKNLALSYGQAGMRRVQELFSMERSVRETEHLYERLLEIKGCV